MWMFEVKLSMLIFVCYSDFTTYTKKRIRVHHGKACELRTPYPHSHKLNRRLLLCLCMMCMFSVAMDFFWCVLLFISVSLCPMSKLQTTGYFIRLIFSMHGMALQKKRLYTFRIIIISIEQDSKSFLVGMNRHANFMMYIYFTEVISSSNKQQLVALRQQSLALFTSLTV